MTQDEADDGNDDEDRKQDRARAQAGRVHGPQPELSNEPPPLGGGLVWLPPELLDGVGDGWCTGAGAGVGFGVGAGVGAGSGVATGAGGAAVTGAEDLVGATGWIVGAGVLWWTGAGAGFGAGGASCSGGTTVRWAGTAAGEGTTVKVAADAVSAWAAPLPVLARPRPNAHAKTMQTKAATRTGRESILGRSLRALGQRLSMRTVFMRWDTRSGSGLPGRRICRCAPVGGHDGSRTQCTCR